MTEAAECQNRHGAGWVYEANETMPLGDGRKALYPGVLCPVCMGGITYAEPEGEARRLAARGPIRPPS